MSRLQRLNKGLDSGASGMSNSSRRMFMELAVRRRFAAVQIVWNECVANWRLHFWLFLWWWKLKKNNFLQNVNPSKVPRKQRTRYLKPKCQKVSPDFLRLNKFISVKHQHFFKVPKISNKEWNCIMNTERKREITERNKRTKVKEFSKKRQMHIHAYCNGSSMAPTC